MKFTPSEKRKINVFMKVMSQLVDLLKFEKSISNSKENGSLKFYLHLPFSLDSFHRENSKVLML